MRGRSIMEKKLYKVTEGKMIAGVCAGFAEYFGIDPTIVRLIWAVISLFFGTGVLLYLICALIMPTKP